MKKMSTCGIACTAMLATLGYVNFNSAIAQTSVSSQPDNETCLALNDSTALDQQSIETRIACYSGDAQHLNLLAQQLIEQRETLTALLSENSKKNTVKEDVYIKELAKRQETLQRMQEHSANLTLKIDAITKERDDTREQLFSALSRHQDDRIDAEANQKLFRNFSQTYIALNTQIDELQKKLAQAESNNRQLTDQKEAQKIASDEQSEQLQSSVTSLELTVAELNTDKRKLEIDLAEANNHQASMKKQLLQNDEQSEQLESSINSLELTAAELNSDKHKLQTDLAKANDRQASMKKQLLQNAEVTLFRVEKIATLGKAVSNSEKEIAELIDSHQTLNTQHESLLAKTTALEDANLATEKHYKTQIGALEKQIAALSAEKATLDKAVANLNSNNDSLTTQSRDQKVKLTTQLAELNTKLDQNTEERTRLARELDVVKPELQSTKKRLSSSTQVNKVLIEDIQTLEQQLQQSAAAQNKLNESLTATKQSGSQTRAELTAKLTSLEKDATSLKTLLSLSRAHSENANQTLADLRTEISASNQRLRDKENQLNELIAEKKRIEANSQLRADKTKSQATSIHEQLLKAGHEDVTVDVDGNQNIGILMGSGRLFRTGSAWLSNDGKAVLTDLAATFDLAKNRRIVINGHSDNIPLGEKLSAIFKDNWGLSMARALATANFLTNEANIAADRISVSGFGATQPIASNDTPEGRQKNRRVEIKLAPATEKIASAE